MAHGTTTGTDAPPATVPDAVVGRLVKQVSQAIRKHHLTTLSNDCLDYFVNDDGHGQYDIDVHERHDAHCGGDPATSPRLFSFELDRATGKLSTDALDPTDGEFLPIH